MQGLERFRGQAVLVTGASRGIGEGIAHRFAREGASLALVANEEGVHQVAEAVRHLGQPAIPIVADVTDRAQVRAAFARAVEAFGRLDVSVHSAGVITIARLADLTEEEWDRVLDVNTKGTFLCCQAAAGHMVRQGYGRIVNLGSGQSREGAIYSPHYAASKFGVIGLTQSLARELAPHGITVNAVCPGVIATDMWEYNDRRWGELLGGYKPGEFIRERIARIPLGRAGTPQDVAGVVAFLASEDAAYVTGQSIYVNGGSIMT
ncbi:MAG: SDR family NAD(P)-dependent oxidoreductase [Anaerolineae bacterium]|nr:SDR family NAD(P)-dependent oxidoreductase [Anaerolineae bacterium]